MSRRLFNYILSLFGINTQSTLTEEEEGQQPIEIYNPEDDAILITQQRQRKQHKKKDERLALNPRSKSVSKKKKKPYLSWIPVDYLLSYIREQEMETQGEQAIDYSSEEDDGTLMSEFKSLRHQVIKTCHALDTERPSAQFAKTKNVILPVLYEKLDFIARHYEDDDYRLYNYIMLGVESLNTKGEVKRQLFESDWSRSLVLAISSLLKNFVGSPPKDEGEVLMVLLDKCDWFNVLKQMCMEFERLDPNWQFRKEYVDVVEMAAHLN